MNEYDALKSIVTNPDWKAVEDVLEDYLKEMFDIRNVDTKLPAEDYKTECIARLRAAENVYKFYMTNKFVSKNINEVEFSFK